MKLNFETILIPNLDQISPIACFAMRAIKKLLQFMSQIARYNT